MQEEKQILDGIRIILDNGWIVKTDELLDYFELLKLREKSNVVEENLKFLEFIYLLGRLFDIDIVKLQTYFDV
jgi:phosphoribosyl-dephospho-CoA transferase